MFGGCDSSSSSSAGNSSSQGSSSSESSGFTVCHDGVTTTVSVVDLAGHLLHGDALGECPSSGSSSSTGASSSAGSTNEGGSSSSSGSSAPAEPLISGLSVSDGIPAGNGGSLGKNSHIVLNLARRLAGNIAPGAFGGGAADFNPQEVEYLCSIQRSLPARASMGFVRTVADYLSVVMGRPVQTIIDALLDPTLCSDISASLLPGKPVAAAAPTAIPVNKDGFPVSTNATWNRCFEATYGKYVLTKFDIQGNPDKDKDGTPRDCAYYNPNQDGIWNFPYYTGKAWMTQFSFGYDSSTKTYSLPAGFVLQTLEKVVQK